MQNHKNNLFHFMLCMRNGIAYAVSLFIILILIYNKICNHQAISTDGLIKMVVWIAGAVFIFNLMFTRYIIKKWNFINRLTIFMVSICLYEGAGFYWLRNFIRKDAALKWLAFIGIVFIIYLACIMIYNKHSKKQGEIYTQALQQYQLKRSMQNGR